MKTICTQSLREKKRRPIFRSNNKMSSFKNFFSCILLGSLLLTVAESHAQLLFQNASKSSKGASIPTDGFNKDGYAGQYLFNSQSGKKVSKLLPNNFLTSDGKTFWDVIKNTGFNNNIDCIGKDAAQHFTQCKTVVMPGEIMISLGNSADDIATAGLNNLIADKQFFVWGDNGAAMEPGKHIATNTHIYALQRIWKVQRTNGFNAPVTVYFPANLVKEKGFTSVELHYGTTSESLYEENKTLIQRSGEIDIEGLHYYSFDIPVSATQTMDYFSFTLSAFSPAGLSGVTSWFKADAGVTLTPHAGSLSTVNKWSNQAGFAFDLTPVTVTAEPAYRDTLWNFNPGINFSDVPGTGLGKTGLPNLSTFLSPQDNEVFGAVQVDLSNSAVYFMIIDGANNANKLTLESGVMMLPGSGVQTNTTLNTTNLTNMNVFNGSCTSSPSLVTNFVLNGTTTTGSKTFSSSLSAGTAFATKYYIGSFAAGSYMRGSFPEVMTFNRSLSTTEKQQVQSYLGIKYGRTMGHNYFSASNPTAVMIYDTTGYSDNIAGIGRDDASSLKQRQSQSANLGPQVIMSLGAIASTNLNNSNNFTNDVQYLVWGDDSAALSPKIVTGKSIYVRRFVRVWKAQATNFSTSNNITVYYPVQSFGASDPASVGFIYGGTVTSLNDGSGNLIPQTGTTSINGVNYYKFSVPGSEVNNIQYFSFTSDPRSPGGVLGQTLWLRADAQPYNDGDSLINNNRLWVATNGNNAGQYYSGTVKPVFKSNIWNYNPVVRFNQGMGIGADYFNTGNQITAIEVINYLGNSTTFNTQAVRGMGLAGASGDGSTTGMIPFRGVSGGLSSYLNNQTVFTSCVSNVLNGTNPGIGLSMRTPAVSLSGNNNNSLYGMWNGSSPTPVSTGATLNFNVNYYTIGGIASGGKSINGTQGFLSGDVPEVILYDNELSATERLQINSYLAIKYGITLNQSGSGQSYLASDGTTAIWTANSTYTNNITGIGRDDLSVLNQKQSRSISSTTEPVIALGSLAADNASNSNSFTTDKAYDVWGNNNGSTTFGIYHPYGMVNKRMTRTWKLQETGTVGSVMVALPATAVAAGFTNISLIIADDATFTTNRKQSVMTLQTINGVQYYTATAVFSGINYFSFGGYQSPGNILINPTRTTTLRKQ